MTDTELRQFLHDNLHLEVKDRPNLMPWTEVRLMMRNEHGGWEIISRITLPVQEGCMTDTQAPDYKGFTQAIMEGWQDHGDVDAFTKFELACRHNILREIPGGYNPEQHDDAVGVCPEMGDPWYEMNDAPDIAAAQTAAAWLAGRDAAADYCTQKAVAGRVGMGIRALTPPADAAAALDALIAERVREAVEVCVEAIRKDAANGDISEGAAQWCIDTIAARSSKEGRNG